MKITKTPNHKGYTLMELLITLGIIGMALFGIATAVILFVIGIHYAIKFW